VNPPFYEERTTPYIKGGRPMRFRLVCLCASSAYKVVTLIAPAISTMILSRPKRTMHNFDNWSQHRLHPFSSMGQESSHREHPSAHRRKEYCHTKSAAACTAAHRGSAVALAVGCWSSNTSPEPECFGTVPFGSTISLAVPSTSRHFGVNTSDPTKSL
jgi:hypothetical protein